MGMVYFLDNDIILKLITYGMLEKALECLAIERENIRVLESARYFFGKNKGVKKKYSEATIVSAIEFVRSCTTISSQNNDEYRLLENYAKNGIDSGESTLIVATFQESASLLVTGDKRCLQALANIESLGFIHKKLQGHVICLEQIICKLIEIQGFEWVLERVLLNLDCDGTVNAAFGSRSNSQRTTVLETLRSYIENLQITSLRILSE